MNVLVPLDNLDLLEEIVEFLAKRRFSPQTRFRLLHVIAWQESERALAVSSEIHTFLARQEELANELLDKAEQQIKQTYPKAKLDKVVLKGAPAELIVEEAASWPADLVVTASHNRKGAAKFFLGSVAKAVATHVPCSVALVRRKELMPKDIADQAVDTRPIHI